jgi:hypothetical protein
METEMEWAAKRNELMRTIRDLRKKLFKATARLITMYESDLSQRQKKRKEQEAT